MTYEHQDSRTADERLEAARMSRARLLLNTAAAAAVGISPTLFGQAVCAGCHHAQEGRRAPGGLRRRRHRRDAQPVPRRDADRRGSHPEPVRPARPLERRPVAQPGPRARVEREQGLHGLRGQAPPGGRVPQRQDVRRRGRHLLDPADGEEGQRRAPVRLEHQARRPEGDQQADGQDPAEDARRRSRGQLRLLQHVDRPGRADRLQAPDRHGPVQVPVVHPGPAERVREEPELLGDGQAVRRLAQDRRDLGQHGAPERAALRPGRHDGAAADGAGEGACRRPAT